MRTSNTAMMMNMDMMSGMYMCRTLFNVQIHRKSAYRL